MKTTPKFAEQVPAITRPVRLPRLVPARGRFLAGVITGGVLIVIDLALLAFYFVVVAR